MVNSTDYILTASFENVVESTPEEDARRIAHIQDKVFKKHKCYSSPFGNKWMIVVGDLIKEIAKQNIKPTKEVIDYLTDWNCHTAANAANIMLQCADIARYDIAI